ncbi:universal stress protein [Kitasatospora sp. NBC_01287]|uniref:universal stress protein n=1 Tax=Kitasatospora sp. NBC_01287 TaxID=2903573 RepID=UPI00225A09DB|nr:universal stress protein [Kitasatospora sp. NBC_01287]MCX4744747.1 universal stress protein [Kitasatospora sp. NBC_01287]
MDGSDSSKAALRWAVRYAESGGGVVEAVIAWEYPLAWYGWTPPTSHTFEYGLLARRILADAVLAAVGPDRPVEIRTHVVQGNPASALLEATHGAALLVVGNRGHGGFAEALLGSVGQHCVHHAQCPVVVVRGPET